MEYIIDGYNLIKSSFLSEYESRGIECSIRMLTGILVEYRRRHPSVSFTVVFDGNPPSSVLLMERNIKVIFSGDISADEVIRKRIEKTPEKNISKVIVSDDRGVKESGRLFGARTLSVSAFLEIVYPVRRKTKVSGKDNETKKVGVKKLLKIEKELKKHYRI